MTVLVIARWDGAALSSRRASVGPTVAGGARGQGQAGREPAAGSASRARRLAGQAVAVSGAFSGHGWSSGGRLHPEDHSLTTCATTDLARSGASGPHPMDVSSPIRVGGRDRPARRALLRRGVGWR